MSGGVELKKKKRNHERKEYFPFYFKVRYPKAYYYLILTASQPFGSVKNLIANATIDYAIRVMNAENLWEKIPESVELDKINCVPHSFRGKNAIADRNPDLLIKRRNIGVTMAHPKLKYYSKFENKIPDTIINSRIKTLSKDETIKNVKAEEELRDYSNDDYAGVVRGEK